MAGDTEAASGSETAAPVASAKVLVVGGSGAGKTTFVHTISEIAPIFGDDTTPLTVDFGRISVDKTLRLYLFGPPEQDRFGFMWNQVAVGALGGVVVVDSQRLSESFPAIDFLESRELPFVVALNHFEGGARPSVRAVRTALDLDADIPVLQTDARDQGEVKKTILELLDIVLFRALAG